MSDNFKVKELYFDKYQSITDRIVTVNIAFKDEYLESINLSEVLKAHYGKFSIAYWNAFLKENIPLVTNVIIVYSGVVNLKILAIALLTENNINNNIYIRCICSNCHNGGNLMRYMITKYKTGTNTFEYIYLHSEPNPNVLGFYKKHGFIMVPKFYIDIFGIRYPQMLYLLNMNSSMPEKIITDFFPGVMFYVFYCYEVMKQKCRCIYSKVSEFISHKVYIAHMRTRDSCLR